MNFIIQQIAIAPTDAAAAESLLTKIGALEWAKDHVTGLASVFGNAVVHSEAELAFNYELGDKEGKLEFEILKYTAGSNWLDGKPAGVSHLGMHCTEEELVQWREFFFGEGVDVAQEMVTSNHTNPVIDGKRTYVYVIFNTRPILGVDLKFIVRKDVAQTTSTAPEAASAKKTGGEK